MPLTRKSGLRFRFEIYLLCPGILAFRMGGSAEHPRAGASCLYREMEKLVTDGIRESMAAAMKGYAKAPVPFPPHLLSGCPAPYEAAKLG